MIGIKGLLRSVKMMARYYSERKDLLKFLKGRILDIGCNKEDFHKLVMERARKISGEVYGLDIEVTNYRDNFVRGDAHFLPFKDESFNSVFAGEIIKHLTNLT
ncbi:MAG: methyltransferase domain-containing protein [Canidatus Methanoxibalbensis ujae]|nr:methyltransferase domain-containing protein [Candidatus Methanoxibalbensis ujae]